MIKWKTKAIKMEYKFDQWLNENNDVVEIDGEHYEPAIVLLRIQRSTFVKLNLEGGSIGMANI